MARIAPVWNCFNAGELSPLIDGRTDQEKYFAGCKTLRNFVPSVQGPARRRGGTRYMGDAKSHSERTWLTVFEFNQAQSYVLALTDSVMRFWVNRGQLLSGASPLEVVTPWTAADLVTSEGTFGLRSVQSADIMWICQYAGTVRPQKLSRLGATSWTVANAPFTNGPFEDIDPDSAVTITASGVTGSVTLTASAAIFTSDDVGTSFYVEQKDGANVKAWNAHKRASVNDKRRFEGNYYKVTQVGAGAAPGTGDNPPVHTEGKVWDGDGITDPPSDNLDMLGVELEYLHSGYGWITIASVGGGGTTATGTVVLHNGVTQLPDGIVSPGTNRWAKSAFSSVRGWPTDVSVFRERLCYIRNRELFFSVTGDFDDFVHKDGPDITKETAIKLKAAATTKSDTIRWAVPFGPTLVAGTASGELSIREQTQNAVFAADNVTHNPETEYGSRLLKPLRVASAVLFVTRSGSKVRELAVDQQSVDGRLKADDLTVLSDHMIQAGVVDFDLQQEPDSLVWFVLGDGTLAALTYNRERGVIAWTPHTLGGDDAFVESVASIAAPEGRRDDLWLSVRRNVNGSTKRYIEVMEDNRLAETDTSDAFYGDCGITYDGAPATVITGLNHLNGETVQVLADGSAHAERTVASNSITLLRAASKVHIGFDSPGRLQTMRADGGTQDGTAQTRRKSIAEIWLRLFATIGGKAGPSFDKLDPIPGLSPDALVGTPPALFEGDRKITAPAEYGTDGYICVETSPMLPMTIAMIAARMEIND